MLNLAKLRQQISQFFGHIPLRIILVSPFVLIIILSGIITSYLSFHNSQSSIKNLAYQLSHEITARIEQHVRNYLDVPHVFHQFNTEAMRDGALDVQNINELERTFWRQTKVSQSVKYIYFANPEGHFIGVQRFPDGNVVSKVRDQNTNKKRVIYALDPYGQRVREKKQKRYDPRERPWYRAAIDKGRPTWSDVYLSAHLNVLQITPATPVYDVDGNVLGVLGVNLLLSQINDFLQNLNIGNNGVAFIMERDGNLIASSTDEAPFVKSLKQSRLQAINSQKPLIQQTAAFLKQKFSHLEDITDNINIEFETKNDRLMLQVSPLRDKRGLDWLSVVIIPHSAVMQDIEENNKTTLFLILASLVIAVLVGLLASRWVISPILELNQAAKNLAAGDLAQQLPTTREDELGELANSFNKMSVQLQASFGQLEEANVSLEERVKVRTQDLAKAYKRLKSSQAQLVQSEKMASLGQMVAGVAHEINTPLGYVKSNVQTGQSIFIDLADMLTEYHALLKVLLGEEALDEAQLEQRIHALGERAIELEEDETLSETNDLFKDTLYGVAQISELVLNLKNFSRLDQAQTDEIDIHQCLDSALNIGKNILKYKVDVEKVYSEIPFISCSPSQLNQVFLNLLSNAAQSIEEHGTIYIKTSHDNHWVHISIQDTGKGMPKLVMRKIFDPFYTTKPIGEGTGLGLSISYQIVQQHGGRIRVASTEGKGTRFIVSLPLKAAIQT
jgi:signal transduction histidine kinase